MVKINLDLNVFLISVLAFLPRCHSMEIPASCLIVILSIHSWKTYYFFNEFYLIKFSNCKTDARNERSNNTQIMVQKSENMSFIIYLIFFAIELIASVSWWSRSIVTIIIIITDIEIISIAFDCYHLEISGLLPEFYQFSFASKLHYSMQSYFALI